MTSVPSRWSCYFAVNNVIFVATKPDVCDWTRRSAHEHIKLHKHVCMSLHLQCPDTSDENVNISVPCAGRKYTPFTEGECVS